MSDGQKDSLIVCFGPELELFGRAKVGHTGASDSSHRGEDASETCNCQLRQALTAD